MNQSDLQPEEPPSPEEEAAARGLADALDSGQAGPVDGEALAVAYLLEAVSDREPLDDLAQRRLRKELVGKVSQPPYRAFWRVAAAASLACLFLSAALLWRLSLPPGEKALDRRERKARAAVAALGSRTSQDSAWASRLASRQDSLQRERLADELRRSRLEVLANRTSDDGKPPEGEKGAQEISPFLEPGGAS